MGNGEWGGSKKGDGEGLIATFREFSPWKGRQMARERWSIIISIPYLN